MMIGQWLKGKSRLEEALRAATATDDDVSDGFLYLGDTEVTLHISDLRCLIERIRTLEAYLAAAVNATEQSARAADSALDFGKRMLDRAAQ